MEGFSQKIDGSDCKNQANHLHQCLMELFHNASWGNLISKQMVPASLFSFPLRFPKQDSMKTIMECFHKNLMEVMLEKELVSNLINLLNSTFFGKKKNTVWNVYCSNV